MASSPSPTTQLLYACVAHNTTILAECTTSAASQTSALAALVLPKIDHKAPQKLTYTHGTNYIHYIAEAPGAAASVDDPADPAAVAAAHGNTSASGLTFFVVADAALARRVAFAFLVAVRAQFFAAFPPATTDYAGLPTYGAAAFNGPLRTLLSQYGRADLSEADALSRVRRDVDDVRGIMGRNIESLLERGERIDLLVDQTDRLGGSARDFRVRSRGLKRQMWWKNAKLMALLVLVAVLIIVTIVLAAKA